MQLTLNPELVRVFRSLNPREQLHVFYVCAEYGRSDIEWVSDIMETITKTNIQYALRLATKRGHLNVLKFLHARFQLTADDARELKIMTR